MNFYFIILLIVLAISIIITILSINRKKNAIEIVNDMGMGWNLANTFDSYSLYEEMRTPDDQITFWGNKVPTRELFRNIKKYGFKTIRFPVTWLHFIDKFGNINPEWLLRVKEVVKWVIKEKMYCILNIHYDGKQGCWLNEGINAKDKFINIWTQLSNEFKEFDEYLIFESMNDIEYYNDYINVHALNQAFIDIVRNSEGKNGDRLLIVSGINKEYEETCTHKYKIPVDPSNKIAVSVHYYYPGYFTTEPEDNPWYYDDNGILKMIPPISKWGLEVDYKNMFTDFQTMKTLFIDKKIPVVITETGVLTEQKKEKQSIRDYLHFIYSLSAVSDGIMTCLFDNSNSGEMKYYDREQDRWFDEVIGENFKKIAKGEFLKPTEFYFHSSRETANSMTLTKTMKIKIGTRKAITAIFNIKANQDPSSFVFGVYSKDKNREFTSVKVEGYEGEKRYDGSYQYTIDISKLDFNEEVTVEKWWGSDNMIFNFFTLELDKEYTIFDFDEYKKNLSSNYLYIDLLMHIFIISFIID